MPDFIIKYNNNINKVILFNLTRTYIKIEQKLNYYIYFIYILYIYIFYYILLHYNTYFI